ncbi:MAG: hypothetical protein JJU00_01215 [Opitutales bacterium]|nr:hypothetical protein [Opitutales bacterium]
MAKARQTTLAAAKESGIRDNTPEHGTAADFLREHIAPDSGLSFVSAYFTIQAYGALREMLDGIGNLRFLFGEPRFVQSLDPDRAEKKLFALTDDGLRVTNQMQQRAVAKACARWIREKVEIRSIREAGLLHGKLYHIADGPVENALVGSSNFTLRGLGMAASRNNIELNLVVNDNRDRRALKDWFQSLWDNPGLVEDVKDEVLRYLARHYANNAPEFIYFLTLYHLFRDDLEGTKKADDQIRQTTLLDSAVWKMLFGFQKDGVKGAVNKLLQFNGCILADSVGLGKTFQALAVIKYFENRNERVLVLCPKKLRENWTVYRSNSRLNPLMEDRFRYDVLSHTDLSRDGGMAGDLRLEDIHWDIYDLVVIDESHNFRNNAPGRPRPDGTRPRSRYERLIDDIIRSGPRSKILLLSATPVNNQIADLRNQLSFIVGGDVTKDPGADAALHKALSIPSIADTCRKAQAQFTAWSKQPADGRSARELITSLGSDFFRLLDSLSIARSRSQIKRYYADEMERLGGFPRRERPRAEYPFIDTSDRFFSFEELDRQISKLTLSLYHPTAELRDDLPPEVRLGYERHIGNFTQEGRERILIAMMKVNFLKRLESSVDSFRITLGNTVAKIRALEEKIELFQKRVRDNPDLDFDLMEEDDLEAEGIAAEDLLIGGKLKVNLAHLNLERWIAKIRDDHGKLLVLLERANEVTPERDAKLARLKEIIAERRADPPATADGRPNPKILVFTAFADTARYLYKHLRAWLRGDAEGGTALPHLAVVAGSGRCETTLGKADFHSILTNFAPLAKERARRPEFPQDEEIDVLVATDCISEGQNLQDCALLINYDIHWNPVRIIQRFGRIDRIGSRNPVISLVNFWPTDDLDAYLDVKRRVEARMALVDLTATGEDNLLNTEQIADLIENDLHYRNRQLRRLREEIIDLEDFEGDGLSLADFSLEDFRLDLLRYLEANKSLLENAPPGLHAVVPADPAVPAARPGVIFCLRHLRALESAGRPGATVNPLGGHFLVYLHDDGAVRYTFAQPKQCLRLFRDLAAGKTGADEHLCDLFDAATRDAAGMERYNRLARLALASIARTFQRRSAASLLAGRDGKLPTAAETPGELELEYELLTWLVIMENTTE